MAQITKDTTLDKILEYPGAEKILDKYKVPCLGCPFAKMEMQSLKIGDICKMYKINLKDILEDLNKSSGKKK